MPTVLTETPVSPTPLEPRRKKWTRSECELLQSSALFVDQDIELVDGDLIDRKKKSRQHVTVVSYLMSELVKVFDPLMMNLSAPIDVAPEDNSANQPQPDVLVLKRLTNHYRTTPQASDLHLVIEVADTSLDFDLTVKAALYARAAIVEYWVVDINARRIIAHRDPQSGVYQSVFAYSEDEKVAPLGSPHAELRVGDVLA